MLTSMKRKLATLPFFEVDGFDPNKIQVHFVDKLPFQPWGNYIAKVWGEYNIYILKSKYADAEALFSSFDGVRLFSHECVHLKQIHEAGSFSAFAIKYLISFIFPALFQYRRIPYEKEAYDNDDVIAGQLLT